MRVRGVVAARTCLPSWEPVGRVASMTGADGTVPLTFPVTIAVPGGGSSRASGALRLARRSRVPVAQPAEPLVEAHRGLPAQGGARPALVEPVRRRQLLDQEAGERWDGAAACRRPHSFRGSTGDPGG